MVYSTSFLSLMKILRPVLKNISSPQIERKKELLSVLDPPFICTSGTINKDCHYIHMA